MTRPPFDESRIDPPAQRDEENGLRPRLAARKEAPTRIVPGFKPQLPKAASRAAARHFAGRAGVPSVRACRPPDAQKRRVAVVAKTIPTPNGGRRVLAQQVAYIRRGALGAGPEDGMFFGKEESEADPRQFVERCQADSFHYRLVINPEDGTELGDLRNYARRLMRGVEQDLGTPLDWIAGAHFDTGRPHLHMMIRGRRASGQWLKVTRSYLTSGLRDRARDLATEILGPRAQHVKHSTIHADRLTALDNTILQAAQEDMIDVEWVPQTLRPAVLRRLVHLENKGWTTPVSPGVWHLPSGLRHRLLRVGHSHAQEWGAARILEHSLWRDQRSRLQAATPRSGERLVGAYVGVQRTSRYADGAHAVVLDLCDGRLAHFLMREVRSVMCLDQIKEGAVVEVLGTVRADRVADKVIAEVAGSNGGVWSAAHHASARPGDWPKFIAFHEKRAQAMSLAGACMDLGGGRFSVPGDYLSLARQADVAQWGEADLKLKILDDRTIDEQVSAIGLTWLDRLMTTEGRPDLSGPFGDAVDRALPERAKRLRITGLGTGEPLVLSEADIHRLTSFEIKSVFETLRQDGKSVFMVASGEGATGVYTGRKHIAGVPFAVLEDPVAHNLIPWSPGMESCRGRTLTAVVQDGAASFRTVRGFSRDLGLG